MTQLAPITECPPEIWRAERLWAGTNNLAEPAQSTLNTTPMRVSLDHPRTQGANLFGEKFALSLIRCHRALDLTHLLPYLLLVGLDLGNCLLKTGYDLLSFGGSAL